MRCHTKVNRQQPYFDVTIYIFVYTAWTILCCYHKITFYNRGLNYGESCEKRDCLSNHGHCKTLSNDPSGAKRIWL